MYGRNGLITVSLQHAIVLPEAKTLLQSKGDLKFVDGTWKISDLFWRGAQKQGIHVHLEKPLDSFIPASNSIGPFSFLWKECI